MKKIICISLIITMLASLFIGCGKKAEDKDISSLIDEAFANIEELEHINLVNITEVKYDNDDSVNSVHTETAIKEAFIGNKDKYEMSTEITVSSMGSEATYETYYKDGYYYTSRYGGMFKTKMESPDAKNYSAHSLINVKYDDMKTVALKDVKEDTSGTEQALKYISFTCKNKMLKKFIKSSIENSGETFAESISIVGSDGEYVINKDGYLTSEKLAVTAKITIDGVESTVTVSSKTTYSDIGKEINPYDPEDSDYTEIKDLSTVIALNSAWVNSTSIYDDSVYIEMDMSTDITQGKNKFGYDREYFRKMSMEQENFAQEVKTVYRTDGVKDNEGMYSKQYYTDGRFYNSSDMYGHKIYSDMDFKTYYTGIYSPSFQTPAHIYTTGMMSDIKSDKSGDETVYSFDLNVNSDEGIAFLQMLFSPYDQFGGDCAAAEKVINTFSGKSYVDKNGMYYKTVVECDILFKFEEGEVTVKCKQELKIHDASEKDISIKFPEFEGYEKMDKADLLGSFSY